VCGEAQVRLESAEVMRIVAVRAGRRLAPMLRAVLPPWWLARFDPHTDAAAVSAAAMAAAFPGDKQRDALLFVRSEVTGRRPREPFRWSRAESTPPSASAKSNRRPQPALLASLHRTRGQCHQCMLVAVVL